MCTATLDACVMQLMCTFRHALLVFEINSYLYACWVLYLALMFVLVLFCDTWYDMYRHRIHKCDFTFSSSFVIEQKNSLKKNYYSCKVYLAFKSWHQIYFYYTWIWKLWISLLYQIQPYMHNCPLDNIFLASIHEVVFFTFLWSSSFFGATMPLILSP